MKRTIADKEIEAKAKELLAVCHEHGYKAFVGVLGMAKKRTSLILQSEGDWFYSYWLLNMVMHEQSIEDDIDYDDLLEHFVNTAKERSRSDHNIMKKMLEQKHGGEE